MSNKNTKNQINIIKNYTEAVVLKCPNCTHLNLGYDIQKMFWGKCEKCGVEFKKPKRITKKWGSIG